MAKQKFRQRSWAAGRKSPTFQFHRLVLAIGNFSFFLLFALSATAKVTLERKARSVTGSRHCIKLPQLLFITAARVFDRPPVTQEITGR
jgi:hypothetical protein